MEAGSPLIPYSRDYSLAAISGSPLVHADIKPSFARFSQPEHAHFTDIMILSFSSMVHYLTLP